MANTNYSFSPPTLHVQADAGKTSAVGLEVYKDGQSVYASHLANMETSGYMKSFLAFVTNGYYGGQVRGVQMNAFDHDMKGSLQTSQRALDIGVEGRGFLVVDTSGSPDPMTPKEYGMKTTGHFQMDQNGFLYDEAGNFLLGAKVLEGDKVAQFSLLSHLERVRIPLTPSVAVATTKLKALGSLPADLVNPGDIKENAVDIYDSLGVVHQLRLHWTKLDGPLVWKLQVSDCEGAKVTKNDNTGESWSEDDAGIIVAFDSVGKYKGFIEPNEKSYTDWNTAAEELRGGITIIENMSKTFRANPSIAVDEMKKQLEALRDAIYTDAKHDDLKAGADKAIAAVAEADIPQSLVKVQEVIDGLQKASDGAFAVMDGTFSPDKEVPKIAIEPWKDHNGNLDGAEPSTIDFKLKYMRVSGNEFQIQTPKQDGSGSTSFQGITISSDGYVHLDFVNQPSKKTWLIPLINYTNNNGFTQDSKNVLRPTPACGDSFVLAGPTISNLGSLRSKMFVTSNVNAPQTLLKAHDVAQASQHNATLYKMAMEVNRFLLQIFSQV